MIPTEVFQFTYHTGSAVDSTINSSCAFAALIHDVDHSGVPNAQLVKEKAHIALAYNNQSCAEQNSINLAFELVCGNFAGHPSQRLPCRLTDYFIVFRQQLMSPRFDKFRSVLCATESEGKRFRQLVVNSVMATDIVDKELKNLRNARWTKAFDDQGHALESHAVQINRKATIVIEHLIQASDISHTMQHWHIYRKWNERFFMECYKAFKEGRGESDPSSTWYKGEMGFFDFCKSVVPFSRYSRQSYASICNNQALIYA